ncbi:MULTISPECIES: hypothetical protein [unclassified Arenimonas]|uniref:post-PEP-CTERM-1 domain-containing protein n=1 Tax=unclassified Arenimonas TaxID=2641713 RepID=UPI00086BB3AE|nr:MULTISPECIES: hypothetical protein [unclassified Arenimonas]ODS64882.1 MAG: hypothetical protein ABS41_00275 [Arenimonas sp. SCN 70-307]
MKSLHLFVLPLALCASAACLAADAPAAETGTAQSMKAGIDRDTGRLRALTEQEQSELASREAGSRAAGSELRRVGIRVPQTEAEAQQTQRVLRNGAVMMDVPMSLMSSLVAERDADGNLVIRHGNEAHAHDHAGNRVEVADE